MKNESFRTWVKSRRSPVARALFRVAQWQRSFSVPVIKPVHSALWVLHSAFWQATEAVLRIFWYTPMFQARLEKPAPRLRLYGGLPSILGPLRISMGEDCRVSGRFLFSGRAAAETQPTLVVGCNVDLGWGSSIAVAGLVKIGDNVRLAPSVMLIGYPGHPLDAQARARGEPETDDQTGDIILEDDVWLATGVTVMPNVTIGRGTIVAARSVVTRDLPPFVLAAGAPAKIVRSLSEAPQKSKLRGAA